MAEEITAEKLKALHQALEMGKTVTFKNGAVVSRRESGRGIVVVRRFGKMSITYDRPTHAYEEAYKLALGIDDTPRPPPQPFWFDPNKRRLPRPEWDACPF